MKALSAFLTLAILFASAAFAVDEEITLRYLLKESVEYFAGKEKEVSKKLNGLKVIKDLGGLDKKQAAVLDQSITLQSCRLKGYSLLHEISRLYKKEDALSSAFVTRTSLQLKDDGDRSLFDFLILPYLEFLNYKTEYLTASFHKSDFMENEAMPYYLSEINIDGFCKRRATQWHYGEDGTHPDFELELPERIAVNDVARSKNFKKFEEINKFRDYVKKTQDQ